MKILHLDAFTGFGGGQKRYTNIAEQLSAKNHELILVSRKNSEVDKIFPGKVYSSSFLGDLDVFSFFRIFQIILREKPDIIHTHSHQDHWIGGIVSKLFPTVKLVHTRHVDFKIKNNFINKWMYSTLTDCIITSCRAIKDTLLASFTDIPNFGDKIYPILTINPPKKKGKKGQIRKELNLKGEIIVSMVTRLVDWKGHKYLFQAIPLIIEKIKNIRFLIVGDGPYLHKLKEMAHRLDIEEYVIFTGFRNDVDNVYADTDISVLPSEMESPGVSIAESIFHEIPVITSNVGGIPEIVKDGYNGFLIEVGDAEAIAERVIKLINDENLYKKIKNNCRKWKEKKMSEKTPAEKIEIIYKKIINRSS
ncbi:MAG: glycosyltransferase family 4 protein [Candidatus Mcinerneyibacterium aminivorans]|uniref:Glycosyltransferase family 4 protein n=1 Tax=Candidatus Mcinerneyibacterium aminivorans TaxID=2703815 RepID=A0A5D0MCS1_9BACT|nr:MAG: glycosyltransferase family 4 protein [Candidatus Mcinerneyibacterium aminivorans]